MPQYKEEIESWYKNRDPWQYQITPDDILRKGIILQKVRGAYERALDIGAGEGWITKDLPAKVLHGIELSDTAASRFPEIVTRVHEPDGKYDLIICTGMMYKHYDYQKFIEWIKNSATKTVLISSIKEWEVDLSALGEPYAEYVFPYREYTQSLKLYDFS